MIEYGKIYGMIIGFILGSLLGAFLFGAEVGHTVLMLITLGLYIRFTEWMDNREKEKFVESIDDIFDKKLAEVKPVSPTTEG